MAVFRPPVILEWLVIHPGTAPLVRKADRQIARLDARSARMDAHMGHRHAG